MVGNVIVGQSGGPTAVINSSLAGVFKTAKDRGAKKVYGMRHGIKGLLDRQYVELSEKIKTDIDFDLLKRTPSSFLSLVATNCLKSVKVKILLKKYLKYLMNLTSNISST